MADLEIRGVEDPESIDGPEDVNFPNFMHHFTVRAQLTKLVDADLLTENEADQVFTSWKEGRD